MTTILVVDDMAIFREPICATLKRAGFNTLTAADGAEALDLIQLHHPEVVLLDMAMPKMDGLSCLRAVRANPAIAQTRVIILTAMSERDAVTQALALGVNDYLLKSHFSSAELLARIDRCLAKAATGQRSSALDRAAAPGKKAEPALAHAGAPASSKTTPSLAKNRVPLTRPSSKSSLPARPVSPAPQITRLTREQTTARLKQHLGAKTLSGNVAEVVLLAGSSGAVAHDLASALLKDPVIAARVLQVANSAAHATRRGHVASVDDAIRNIGFKNIRNLAAGIAVFDAIPQDDADGYNVLRSWQHSFAVASIMTQLPKPADLHDGTIHLVGLCHDLPEIVLRQIFINEYQSAIEYAEKAEKPLDDIEAEMFGMRRHELAAIIFSQMALPEEVTQPIYEFIRRTFDRTARLSPIARLLRLANYYAHGMFLAPSPQAPIGPLTKLECQATLAESDPKPIDPATLRAEVLTLTAILATRSGASPSQSSDPAPAQTHIRLAYGRDKSYSTIDPISAALSSLVELATHDKPQTLAQEFPTARAALIVAPSALKGDWQIDVLTRAAKDAERPDLPMLYLAPRLELLSTPLPRNIKLATYPLHLGRFIDHIETLTRSAADQG